jgi:diacylglycerol O-acyltransferase
MLIRLHHVVADDIAALALIGALLDATSDAPAPATLPRAPHISPAPGTCWPITSVNTSALRQELCLVPAPRLAIRRLGALAGQVRQLVHEGLVPRVSLNRPVGKHRGILLVRADLERAGGVAHTHGGKVNDVVLAAVAGGARKLMEARGELNPGLGLKASVAASIRGPADDRASGNRVGIMLVPQPVGDRDPIRRVAEITRASAERKRRPPYQPSTHFLQRWMAGAMSHQRPVNLFTSNLPGPPIPVYFAGARVLEVFQVGVVQGNVTLSVGVLSYAGQLNFAVVADADVTPDLAVFAEGLSDALEQLGSEPKESPLVAQGGER